MKKRPPPFRPLHPLKVAALGEDSFLLRSPHEVLEGRVIAENIFRLRIARGRSLSREPSWAVIARAWPRPAIEQHRSRGAIRLSTPRGELTVRLMDGSWELRDHQRHPLLSGAPGQTGFRGGQPSLALRLGPQDKIFGLGETTGPLNKRGLRREFWNSDVLGIASAIHPGLQKMYLSVPFGITLRGHSAAGVFWDNPHRQIWNVGEALLDRWTMEAAGGEVDLYLISGPDLPRVVRAYLDLTGHMPLPPRWALGYHQSRYSYETRARVEQLAADFRRRKIPCDALYLDIHHMDRYRVFTFGRSFPKPAEMLRRLARRGFKVVAIVDPGVKNDRRFGVLRRGMRIGAFVKSPRGGRDYIGKVWPGPSRFPDFLGQATRSWWSGEQAVFQRRGLAGFWNDMNEPANFALPSKTLPENCRHATDHGPRKHGQVHNVYGMQMARASRDGALRFAPNRRPFIISRAGYAGVQRYAMVWTGDNSSNWEHLAESIPMLLNLSLSGLAFCGADVGGFLDSATGELLARWTQFAAFTPFFRNHANNESRAQEPWVFGSEIETICRRFIEWRYRLLPYLYGLFRESHETGTPIIRPLFWEREADPQAMLVEDQFLLGDRLLVAPILRPGGRARQVYLPAGRWFDFWTGREFSGAGHILALADLGLIPLYVPAGAIIPMAAVQPFVGAASNAEIELHLWPRGTGRLAWYEDDGISLDYEKGVFHRRIISLQWTGRTRELVFGPAEGPYRSAVKRWRIQVHDDRKIGRPVVSGGQIRAREGSGTFVINNHSGEMRVNWSGQHGGGSEE